jgi:hypothetical protein
MGRKGVIKVNTTDAPTRDGNRGFATREGWGGAPARHGFEKWGGGAARAGDGGSEI